jgi:hypothetical protein
MRNALEMIRRLVRLTAISIIMLQVVFFIAVSANNAQALALTNTYIRLSRIKSGTSTTFRLVFKAASSGTNQIAIDFNGIDTGTSQWTNATPGGVVTSGAQSVSTTQCVTDGFNALPGVSGANGSGSTITTTGVTATTINTTYCADFTTSNAVTTPTAGHEGEYHPTVTQGADATTTALRIIANDQIVITASVPPIFNFVLNGNTDTFSTNLSTSTTSTAGRLVTITTNSPGGWIAWTKGLNASSGAATKGALKSASAGNFTIPTTNSNTLGGASHTLSAGQDYGLGVTIATDAAGGGTVTLDPAYDGTGTKIGVIDPSNFRPIATANGTANGDILTLTERAIIDANVPSATDYTDTLTVIGAGNF